MPTGARRLDTCPYEFEKRRGYRLQGHLPALFGNDSEEKTAVYSPIIAKPSRTSYWILLQKNGRMG